MRARLHFNAQLAGAFIVSAVAIGAACDPKSSSNPPAQSDGSATTAPAPEDGRVDGGAPPIAPGPGPADAGPPLSDGSLPEASLSDAASPDSASPPLDPCPNLPIPTTAFNRSVLYREWSVSAVGDGSYFVSQAPYRLGFTRVRNRVWIIKFRTEANSYVGRMSAGSDSVGGLSWISSAPDDANWALQHDLVAWSGTGNSLISFLVVKDDADQTKLATDPSLSPWRGMPTLRGDHCYYFGFENATTYPAAGIDASFWNSSDDCGATGNGTCWYLGIDVGHLLRDPSSGATIAGNVIPGLTH
jgi:hypothetical protein